MPGPHCCHVRPPFICSRYHSLLLSACHISPAAEQGLGWHFRASCGKQTGQHTALQPGFICLHTCCARLTGAIILCTSLGPYDISVGCAGDSRAKPGSGGVHCSLVCGGLGWHCSGPKKAGLCSTW